MSRVTHQTDLNDPTCKLVAKIDDLLDGKDTTICANAILTVLTYYIAGQKHICDINMLIEEICKSLKKSVAMQIQLDNSENTIQ